MKKSVLFLLMVVVLLASFTLCAAADAYSVLDVELSAYYPAGGMMHVTRSDGTTLEGGSWVFSIDMYANSITLREILEIDNITSMEAVLRGDELEGWMAYEVVETDDSCEYILLSDVLFTWEDLLATPMSAGFITYDLDSVAGVAVSDAFGGSMDYDVVVIANENGSYNHILVSEILSVTEDEQMVTPLNQGHVAFVAKWASIDVEDYFTDASAAQTTFFAPPSSVFLFADGGELVCRYMGQENTVITTWDFGVRERPGQPLSEALAWEELMDVTREGAELDGWDIYEVLKMNSLEEAPAEDVMYFRTEWGGEAVFYYVLYDYNVLYEGLSTEEMLNLVVDGERDIWVVARWN